MAGNPLSQETFDLWREGDVQFKQRLDAFIETQVATNAAMRADLAKHEQDDVRALGDLERQLQPIAEFRSTIIKWVAGGSGLSVLGFVVDFFKNHWR